MVHFTKHLLPFVTERLEKTQGNYLEIGVYDGESISYLSDKFPQRQIYGIDPFIEDGNTSWNSQVTSGGILQLRDVQRVQKEFSTAHKDKIKTIISLGSNMLSFLIK